jgi:hypothetical protein
MSIKENNMRTAVQIFSWVSIVIGVLAILGGFAPDPATGQIDPYAFLGGGLFLIQGLLTIIYLSQNKEN